MSQIYREKWKINITGKHPTESCHIDFQAIVNQKYDNTELREAIDQRLNQIVFVSHIQ